MVRELFAPTHRSCFRRALVSPNAVLMRSIVGMITQTAENLSRLAGFDVYVPLVGGFEGDTLFHALVRSGYFDLVAELIRQHCPGFVINARGETPADLLRASDYGVGADDIRERYRNITARECGVMSLALGVLLAVVFWIAQQQHCHSLV